MTHDARQCIYDKSNSKNLKCLTHRPREMPTRALKSTTHRAGRCVLTIGSCRVRSKEPETENKTGRCAVDKTKKFATVFIFFLILVRFSVGNVTSGSLNER